MTCESIKQLYGKYSKPDFLEFDPLILIYRFSSQVPGLCVQYLARLLVWEQLEAGRVVLQYNNAKEVVPQFLVSVSIPIFAPIPGRFLTSV